MVSLVGLLGSVVDLGASDFIIVGRAMHYATGHRTYTDCSNHFGEPRLDLTRILNNNLLTQVKIAFW